MCIILSDRGVDFSPKNIMNSLFYYRLFKELDYDMLSVSTYAARYSAYNPIKHASSPLSNMLAGVSFSSKMEGDSKPPCKQSKLPKIQLQEKEFSVFNKAIFELKGYWKDAKFDSYPVVIDTVKCGEDELRWNNYDRVKTFSKSPLREIYQMNAKKRFSMKIVTVMNWFSCVAQIGLATQIGGLRSFVITCPCSNLNFQLLFLEHSAMATLTLSSSV